MNKEFIRSLFVRLGIGYALGFSGAAMLALGNPIGAVLMAATFVGYVFDWDHVSIYS